mgnify:FL=1
MSTPAKKPRKRAAKTKATTMNTTKASATEKSSPHDTTPLMAYQTTAGIKTGVTSSRRNRAADIERTDKYKNIEDGLVPFRFTSEYGLASANSLDIRDAVILCQKAYYNFATFRNVIDLMTEFSIGSIYFKGGSKKSRKFFEALLERLNIWDFQDKFFREYYRSGNVFIYRFDAKVSSEDVKKITQTFGGKRNLSQADESIVIPASYILLNPADIRMTGSLSFNNPLYFKMVSNYELEQLRNPRTEQDKEMFNALDTATKQLIKTKRNVAVRIPLPTDKVVGVFYKKQDYEPFAVPMGYPVLADINFKDELKKMDMAIARTMQQAILLVTMGTDPEKGGINQRNLQAMQELFQNESVGRVLIADYTTKAEFVVPGIGDLMDPKKYEVFERDINNGLNNILVGGEKFSNQESKVKVFVARLQQGRQSFLNNFLIPEIKKLSKELGFKNFPTPYFEEMSLQDSVLKDRVYARLLELGVLTPQETFTAIETGRLPDEEASLESQEEFRDQKNKGLYSPLMGGGANAPIKVVEENINVKKENGKQTPPKEAGRPPGTEGIPQSTTKQTPVGEGEGATAYSLTRIKENMILAQKIEPLVAAQLKKSHKVKRLNKNQKEVVSQISNTIIVNETPEKWVKSIAKYCKNPIDHNLERVEEVQNIAATHDINIYLASILASSLKKEK